jgi:hypothetical protein
MELHSAQNTQLRNARITEAAFRNERYEGWLADHGQSKISNVSVQSIVSFKPMLNRAVVEFRPQQCRRASTVTGEVEWKQGNKQAQKSTIRPR